ncbi:MAG: hypothetical protein AABW85_05140 [archaeon]
MAREQKLKGKIIFRCNVCGLKYGERKTAELCEKFCSKHPNLCDPKIAEKAIKE